MRAKSLSEALGDPQAAFQSWVQQHNKVYEGTQEYELRYSVWLENVAKTWRLQQQHSDSNVQFGLNEFSDLTQAQFRERFIAPAAMTGPGLSKRPHGGKSGDEGWIYQNVTAAKHVDWRDHKIVGPIRDQHEHNSTCGACWAFASVGVIEATAALSTGKMLPASEQQLIDCDRKYDKGCDGGGYINAINYVILHGGLTTEKNYPYVGYQQECNDKKANQTKVEIQDWLDVPWENERALMKAVTERPVLVAVCCGDDIDAWHAYSGGVFDVPCCEDKLVIDHAMVAVGYGEEDGKPYWLLKNSWGTSWGLNGFMKIKRFSKHSTGHCGLASFPTMVFTERLPDYRTAGSQDAGRESAAASANKGSPMMSLRGAATAIAGLKSAVSHHALTTATPEARVEAA